MTKPLTEGELGWLVGFIVGLFVGISFTLAVCLTFGNAWPDWN